MAPSSTSSGTHTPSADLEELAVNTIRVLSVDAVQKANSGHPGLPMGCADLAYVLFTRHLKFDPKDPSWPDRDRFVLSAGHGSMLLYSLLHLTGYDLPIRELERFRQLDSHTPGHPELLDTPGVETTTGPLGQGFANAVGMALSEALLAARYNTPQHKVVDHHTYVLASDGDLMEGISHEAASLAGHLRLHKLVCLYDDNLISLDGPTKMAFTENVEKRFQAYGWSTQKVDGHDRKAVDAALAAARAQKERPTLILCRTILGKGSPHKANTHEAHGSPLGPDEVAATRAALGWNLPPFRVPEEVGPLFQAGGRRGAETRARWIASFEAWRKAEPQRAAQWERALARKLPEGWTGSVAKFAPEDKPLATRAASGKIINSIAKLLPELIGGSADLASSNNTAVAGEAAVSAESFAGRNLWFGVREHAMGGILNGMSLHGGIRPYGATFMTFSDYMKPSIRLAALMRQPVIYVFTHDSIFLGEDGPTHQPVEHLASLRSIPNLSVIRPSDANETAAAWIQALERTEGPTALVLSRQNLPIYAETAPSGDARRGGHVVERESGGAPAICLIATGSEVSLARDAAKLLKARGISARVVSLASWDIFESQDAAYRSSVLPDSRVPRLVIEAASTFGWERYAGVGGKVIGMHGFGASAPIQDLQKRFGFTPEAVAAEAEKLAAGR